MIKFNRIKIANLLCYYILPVLFFIIYSVWLGLDHKGAYNFSLELGIWSWRLLIFIIFIGPLIKIFPNIGLLKKLFLRKQLGVLTTWLFLIHLLGAVIHKELYSINDYLGFTNYLFWGLLAGIIMIILGLTSNNYSIKKLNGLVSRGWKKLHRTAYLLFIFVVIHAYLISGSLQYLIFLGLYLLVKFLEFTKVKFSNKYFYGIILILIILLSIGFVIAAKIENTKLTEQNNALKEKFDNLFADDDYKEEDEEDDERMHEKEDEEEDEEDEEVSGPIPSTTPEPNPLPITAPEPTPSPEPAPIPVELIPNKSEIISECNSLCKVDKVAYCTEKRTLVFNTNTHTEGSCRVFSKYVSGFSKCEGYCESYGEENGCYIDGTRDPNCDGK